MCDLKFIGRKLLFSDTKNMSWLTYWTARLLRGRWVLTDIIKDKLGNDHTIFGNMSKLSLASLEGSRTFSSPRSSENWVSSSKQSFSIECKVLTPLDIHFPVEQHGSREFLNLRIHIH